MAAAQKYPLVGPEEIMSPKAHGTCAQGVQATLRYGCDVKTADKICCFNRHYAEHSGYMETVSWVKEVENKEVTYYDSVTGKPAFVAPRGRTWAEFLEESRDHGWPSFRDQEVVWENVRCLKNGETVSLDGTHLGHNLPDRRGNRYCINLVSIAGNPVKTET
jgi:peptide methionine sulfoxide reductase MsrB